MIKFEITKTHEINMDNFNNYINNYKDFTGWLKFASIKEELPRLKMLANQIKGNSNVLLVVGVGGSYMASRAIISSLRPYFESDFETYYLGYQLSDEYYNNLINQIKDKDITINIISKSGGTFEVKKFYTILLEFMKTKYSEEEIKKRIIITTCEQESFFYNETKTKNYELIIHPKDVGGRYSAFTTVHMLSLLVNNIKVDELIKGAEESLLNIQNNINYASFRLDSYKKGFVVEAYTVWEEKYLFLTEWLKQLFAESLGKGKKGVLPISVFYNRDLHSLEQFYQDGNPILFDTIINTKTVGELNDSKNMIKDAVVLAHKDIPKAIITLDKMNEYNLGYLMQFMMLSCAISGYAENINAFDQEGVEKYKKAMKN